MFRIHPPVLIAPTAEVREALGPHLQTAGLAAYREIAVAAKGWKLLISSSPLAALRSPSLLGCAATV
jgi:hypothetical protein